MAYSRSYLFLYGPTPVDNNAWLHATSFLAFFTITGLEPGKQYSFRMGIVSTKGQTVYTEIISKLVV